MKLALILVLLLTGAGDQILKSDFCDSFKIESKVSVVQNTSQYEVEVTATGGASPYRYIFLNEKGAPLSKDYNLNKIKYSSKDDIYCTVVDAGGCQKKIKIEIR